MDHSTIKEKILNELRAYLNQEEFTKPEVVYILSLIRKIMKDHKESKKSY